MRTTYLGTLLGFLLISSLTLSAQHKELAVDLYGQGASNWCWAASMDMVMDYQLPSLSINQCELAVELLRVKDEELTPAEVVDCLAFCATDCDLANPPDPKYNPYIDFSKQHLNSASELIRNYKKAQMDILFTENGFWSMEDHMKLDWDQYKEEIRHCRPVVFFYEVDAIVKEGTDDFNHVVVGKGYTTITGTDASSMAGDYFIVNDPWSVCKGESYLLHKNAATGWVSEPTTGDKVLQVNHFYAMAHHISPKQESCDPCKLIPAENRFISPKENKLLTFIRRYRPSFAGTAKGPTFSPQEIKVFEEKGHFSTKVNYFSYEYFNSYKGGSGGLNFNDAVIKIDAREITYPVSDPPLMTRIRCDEKAEICAVEKIGFGEIKPSRIVAIPEGNKVLLNNDPKYESPDDLPRVNYSIVRFHPTTFEFYRFESEGSVYYYPIESYAKTFFYGQEFKDSNVAIPEKLLLAGLEKFVKDFDDPKLVEKTQRYREKYQNILDSGGFLKMDKYLKRLKF